MAVQIGSTKLSSQLQNQLESWRKSILSQEKGSFSPVSWFTELFPQKKTDGPLSDGSTKSTTKKLTLPFGRDTSDLTYWDDALEPIVRGIARDYARILDKVYPSHNYSYHVSNMKFCFGNVEKLGFREEIGNNVLVYGIGGQSNGNSVIGINRPHIERLINRYYGYYGCYYLTEYSSYKKDPKIGSISTSSFWIWIMTVVCHELAHVFQFIQINATGHSDDGHGPIFQHHYKVLREMWVNPYLKEEKQILYEQLQVA